MTGSITCYLAPEGGEKLLQEELKGKFQKYGRLFISEEPIQPVYWTQNVWKEAAIVPITSIQHAVKLLRNVQKQWALWPTCNYRRSLLIQESLPKYAQAPLVFPLKTALNTPIGSWTLLKEDLLLYSKGCSSPLAHGEWKFAPPLPHHSLLPPSQAYLKLWEACCRLGRHPLASEKCLELGACPGSWTWAVSQLGAEVLAVDRAPLAHGIDKLPAVAFARGDAFQYTPKKVGKIDWLLSDLICYPEKLYEFLLPWIDSGLCRYFICTLKFQGKPDPAIIQKFADIPGSQIFHLFHNKHELTWTLGF